MVGCWCVRLRKASTNAPRDRPLFFFLYLIPNTEDYCEQCSFVQGRHQFRLDSFVDGIAHPRGALARLYQRPFTAWGLT